MIRNIISVFIILLMSANLVAQNTEKNYFINDFESNPYTDFQISAKDQSGIILNSSADRRQGLYALEIVYYLKSTMPTGSDVSLSRYYKEESYLNLENIKELAMDVKGDGSDNVLQVIFIDGTDEQWVYENKNVLKSNKWQKIFINLSSLYLASTEGKNNNVFDKNRIKGYKIVIYSRQSSTMQGIAVKETQGSVLLDNFVIADLAREEVKAVIEENPVKLNGTLYGEYFRVKKEINTLRHWGKLDVNAHYNLVSAKMVLASESQDFGQAVYRENEFDAYTGQLHQNYPRLIMPFLQLQVNEVSSYIRNITFGNLWFDYNKYVFSPTLGYDDVWGLEKVVPDWGLKGVSTEGDLQFFNYHAFIIKGSMDSYTAGLRFNTHINKQRAVSMDYTDIKFYYVKSEDTARFTNENKIKKFADDQVFGLDLSTRFFKNTLGIELFSGYNIYKKTGQIDYSDPYDPVYQQPLTKSISEKDEAYKAKVILDNYFLPGIYSTYEFRKLGKNFKPKYRREPIIFDDIDSDQLGHNVLASYSYWGFTLSGEYDQLTRISNKDFYRRKRGGGISCNKLKNVFIAYFLEWKREYYEYVSTRSFYNTARNDEIVSQEVFTKLQVRYNLDFSFKIRSEDVKWPKDDKKFNTQSIYLKMNYYLANNFSLFGEGRATRFGDPSWFSPGYNPYIDDFVRMGVRYDF